MHYSGGVLILPKCEQDLCPKLVHGRIVRYKLQGFVDFFQGGVVVC